MEDSCSINRSVSWSNLETTSYFLIYFGLLPTYATFGLLTNGFLLCAFFKESKTEGAYAYQAMLSVAILCDIVFSASTIFWYRVGIGIESPPGLKPIQWIIKNYWIMYTFAHIGMPLGIGCMVCCLLFTVAMSADRVLALWKPFLHRSINRKRHQTVAAILCVVFGMGTSVEDAWAGVVSAVGDHYAIGFSEVYFTSPVLNTLTVLRSFIRFSSLSILILLNTLMVFLYKKKTQTVVQFAGSQQTENRKALERTLLLLCVSQSVLTLFNQIPHLVLWTLFSLGNRWVVCNEAVIFPLADFAVFGTNLMNVFVIAAVDHKIRILASKVWSVLRCKCGNAVSTFVP